ncbi:hypothetical protein IV203_030818 [Nitzschia inconspicua]|uniref:Uncharacterized protein n=1 Tax=Nitzschia inconspicua TaxID=303405 RepID=A0A9K3LT61_9STRA|nr:hypothetical protein IV203_030818 [Nitzschia inconspicua]
MAAKPPVKFLFRRSEDNIYVQNEGAHAPIADLPHNSLLLQQPKHPPPLHQQRRRKVRFDKTIHNRRIPHLNNMSQSLRESIWIQPDEYLEIRQRCVATLQIMAMGEASIELMESEDFCPRGLEAKTREGALRRREYKLDSIHAVLEEQQNLWNDEIEDDEAIMEAYQMFSVPCAEDAYERGAWDEAAVQEYLLDDDCCYFKTEPLETTAIRNGIVDKITDVLFKQTQRAALLKEIEDNFYEESSIERRRKHEEEQSYKARSNSSLTMSLREFFSKRCKSNARHSKNDATDAHRQEDDLPSLAWDEDSSNCSSAAMCDSNMESFTSELSDVFHSRTKRLSLLAEIEGPYSVESSTVSKPSSTMPSIADKVKCGLTHVLGGPE